MNRNDAIDIITQNLEEIRKLGVISIGIFGSTARNEAKDDSDIDVIVKFEKDKINFDNYMDLKFYLEKIFQKKVDVLSDTAIKPYAKEKILQDVIYAA